MRHRKKFISKKNATVFKLIPQEGLEDFTTSPEKPSTTKEDKEAILKRKEEQVKYGIYFDDDYDYLQHLRERKPTAVMVPVSELAAHEDRRSVVCDNDVDEDEVYDTVIFDDMSFGTPIPPAADDDFKPTDDEFWDPEIAEALENAPTEEEADLEDDFFLKADESPDDDDCNEETKDAAPVGQFDDADLDEPMDEEDTPFEVEDNRPRTIEDDIFDKMVDDFDAAEEEEDHTDHRTPPSVATLAQFRRLIQLEKKNQGLTDKLSEDLKEKILHLSQMDEQLVAREIEVKPRRDSVMTELSQSRCETPLHLRPKIIDSQPTAIKKISLDPRTGIPKNVLTKKKVKELESTNIILSPQTRRPSEGEDSEALSSKLAHECTIRPKQETPQERRERKAIVKLHNRERRIEKKANRVAFKQEEVKQKKVAMATATNHKVIKLH